MTITIYPQEPTTIILYQPDGFPAWKRVPKEGITLPEGANKLALMGHIYGYAKPETIIPVFSNSAEKGGQIAEVEFPAGSQEQPLTESHRARVEFG